MKRLFSVFLGFVLISSVSVAQTIVVSTSQDTGIAPHPFYVLLPSGFNYVYPYSDVASGSTDYPGGDSGLPNLNGIGGYTLSIIAPSVPVLDFGTAYESESLESIVLNTGSSGGNGYQGSSYNVSIYSTTGTPSLLYTENGFTFPDPSSTASYLNTYLTFNLQQSVPLTPSADYSVVISTDSTGAGQYLGADQAGLAIGLTPEPSTLSLIALGGITGLAWYFIRRHGRDKCAAR